MSHYEWELFLWDAGAYGLPETLEQASEMMVALQSLPAQPTAAMCRFVERALAVEQESGIRFANGNTLQLFHFHDRACLRLELASDNRQNALRLVSALAQAEGLAGYIEMLGVAFLPDGSILPASQRRAWEEAIKPPLPKPASMNYQEFFNYVDTHAREFFCANGFVYGMAPWLKAGWTKMVYRRTHGDITQAIELNYSEGDLQLEGTISLYSEKISSIIRKFDLHDHPQSFMTFFYKVAGDSPLYRKKAWKQKALDKALSALLDSVIAWLDKADSIEALGKVMLDECHGDLEIRRRNDDFLTFNIPDLAVVCRMTNDSRFEELVVQFDKVRRWGGPELEAKRQTAWPQMLKYLREEYS